MYIKTRIRILGNSLFPNEPFRFLNTFVMRLPSSLFQDTQTPQRAQLQTRRTFPIHQDLFSQAPPVASCELPPVLVLEEVAVLLAAAICHAGIAALPDGAPVLNGLAARP